MVEYTKREHELYKALERLVKAIVSGKGQEITRAFNYAEKILARFRE